MDYLVTFLEGLASFISPCSLPLVPVYIAYFATETENKNKVFLRALCFCLGFTLMFSILGVFAGSVGRLFNAHREIVNIVSGVLIALFGVAYIFDFHFKLFKQKHRGVKPTDCLKAFLFGLLFSINVSPCIGVFLGSALMMAGTSGSTLKGLSLLFVYSLGLGTPFLLSALLIQKLTPFYTFIKKHYRAINIISGVILIVTGILIALGVFSPLSSKKLKSPQKAEGTNNSSNSDAAVSSSRSTQKSTNASESLLVRRDLFTVKDKDNHDVPLSKFFGKPIFVNFWASWCGPCEREFPHIEKAYKEYGDKVEFMLVNLTYADKGNIEDTLSYINEKGYTAPIYFDLTGEAASKFDLSGIPLSVFYNSTGTKVFTHMGQMNYEMLTRYLEGVE